jgi:2-desacetyl-2-hydroxyethyl bacteriochlorophyllide A dehydrogenase
MRALYIDKPHVARLGEAPEPKSANGDVLLEIRVIGFCGTDLNTFRGKNPLVVYPRIPGHEIAATIREVGSHVPAGLSIGRNVAVLPYNNCGRCASCRRLRPNACLNNKTLGVQQDGALSAFFRVPWQKLHPADQLGLRELALVEPLAVGFHAIQRGRVEAQDVVAVVGCGTVGLSAIAAASARGATVIAIDLEDAKLSLARMAGAAHTINSRTHDASPLLKDITHGHGPDVVVEAVGTPDTFRFAVEVVAYTGRVVYIGYAKEPVAYETRLFILKELDILGARNSATEFPTVIRMLEAGRFPVEATVSTTVPFEDAAEALAAWNADPKAFTKIHVQVS